MNLLFESILSYQLVDVLLNVNSKLTKSHADRKKIHVKQKILTNCNNIIEANLTFVLYGTIVPYTCSMP